MRLVKWLKFSSVVGMVLLMAATCPKTENIDGDQTRSREAQKIFVEAEGLYDAGSIAEAKPLYESVAAQFPSTESARHSRFRLGQISLKEGDSDAALAQFNDYVDLYGDDSELALAQDYVSKILQNKLTETETKYKDLVTGLQRQNFRLDMLNQSLRRSVDSEAIYLEIDLASDRLLVKLGTQALYEYPVVSGKGKTWLRSFATPKGVRQVESIEKDPKWYRPDWVWEEKGLEVPEDLTMEERAVPGALGPYKVSFGDGYYIHGTRAGRIRPGKYSHGCVRMNNSDLKNLVKLIDVGTLLYIY